MSSGETFGAGEVEAIWRAVGSEFSVLEADVTGRGGGSSGVVFRCEATDDEGVMFGRLREKLGSEGFVPFMSEDGDGIRIVVRKERIGGSGKLTVKHLLLFSATVFTTLLAGSLLFGVNPLESPLSIWRGWPFSVSIMLVLGAHEIGHYLMSKRRGSGCDAPLFHPRPTSLHPRDAGSGDQDEEPHA